MKTQKFKIKVGKNNLQVEIKNLAEQASGSCFVQYGDTLLLATAVMAKTKREGIDYFPLTVNFEERYYAAGKILGSRYFRREGRPSDEAVLTSRLIDRAIRPRFPEGLKKDVQVIITCLSWDKENDPDTLGLLASSISLLISDIPWSGPVAALRIGRINEKFVLNPTYQERENSDLDLIVSSVEKNNEIFINMIEVEGKEVSEELIVEAIDYARSHLKKLIAFQKKIAQKLGLKKQTVEITTLPPEIKQDIKGFLEDKLEKAIFQPKKEERSRALKDLEEDLLFFIEEKYPENETSLGIKDFFEKETKKLIHKNIISKEKRPDNRKVNEIRDIDCEAGLLPRTHGSGLFCRGQTKSLSILTLGAPGDVKLLEGMEITGKKHFMHHYNFPPYSVGETKPLRSPGRREIGHGALVEKALHPLLPDLDQFPYTIRIVSEMLSSNGSTSMASISSSSLALMDAGVPIKSPAAGIAIGLMIEKEPSLVRAFKEKKYKLLTDIQGPEDQLGDMDFKVAGTRKGITTIQLDVKILGLPKEVIKEILFRAKKARLQILDEMKKVLSEPRSKLSPFAPRVFTLQISPDKIGDVIGPGGSMINSIIEECEVSIDIEDSGKVFITSESEGGAKKAVARIKNITREVKGGEVFQGKVTRILDFGAMVEVLPGKEGLIHISKLSRGRINKVEDVVRKGDVVQVKVASIDEQGRINLLLLRVVEKKHGRKK